MFNHQVYDLAMAYAPSINAIVKLVCELLVCIFLQARTSRSQQDAADTQSQHQGPSFGYHALSLQHAYIVLQISQHRLVVLYSGSDIENVSSSSWRELDGGSIAQAAGAAYCSRAKLTGCKGGVGELHATLAADNIITQTIRFTLCIFPFLCVFGI
ncbi:hypothetical protein F157LOC_00763 [Pectobacterium brasiliense]|nr:hypothetical protein F157LOC_00763 [Pectobacterium brasiliense]